MSAKNIALVLSSLGVAQALLLCIYLFTLKEKKANLFLALALLGILAEAVAVSQEQNNIAGIRDNVYRNAHFKLDARISISGPPMFRLQATWGQVMVRFEGELLTLIGSTPRYAALFLIIGLFVFLVGKKR